MPIFPCRLAVKISPLPLPGNADLRPAQGSISARGAGLTVLFYAACCAAMPQSSTLDFSGTLWLCGLFTHSDGRPMEICFVLDKPLLPENIGASARALYTMGFESLRLVRPAENHLSDRAKWLACGGVPVLEQAQVFDSLEQALADVDFCAGTTGKIRHRRRPYYTPGELSALLEKKGAAAARAAIIFGTESSGLSNEALQLCDVFSTIPARESCTALNLAQAVMVYAYELSALQNPVRSNWTPAKKSSHQTFRRKVSEALEVLGIDAASPVHSRIIERTSALSDKDIRLIHFIRRQILKRIGAK